MFKNLLQFEVFYQRKQRAFPLFVLFFFALGMFIGQQGFAPKGVDFNSIYQVYFHTSIFSLGSVFVIMFFAISSMLRDKSYQMDGLVFSSSIKKSHYFYSKFLGTFFFSVLSFTPFLIGYAIGNSFPGLDFERVGEFQLLTYVQPWFYIVLPNIFICTTILFSVSALTKSSLATYVGAVFVYMLYFVSSIYLNSPIIAQSVPASPENMVMAAIADPFGIAAFIEQTQYWTAFQKNNQLVSFSGLFLKNRIIWVVASLILLLVAFGCFSFSASTKKVKKQKTLNKTNTPLIAYKSNTPVHNLKGQLKAFISLLKLELQGVFKSLPFIAIMLIWVFIVSSQLYARIIRGEDYGVSVYPFTNKLIELIVNPLTFFSLILILFYSAEIVWKERSLNFNLIVDAIPIKNWVFFLSKFTALLALPFILIVSGIVTCIAFQVGSGYTNLEFPVYASMFYYYGLPLAVYCMIAFFVNNLVKNKFVGMGLFGLIVLSSIKSDVLGLEHPLTSLGFMPRVSYSNVRGFYDGPHLFHHLAIYWMAFGLLLTAISFKMWNRGLVSDFKEKIQHLKNNTKSNQIVFSILIMVFFGAAGIVFYNTNIVSEYTTIKDQLDFRETYERNYKSYENLERPFPVSRKTKVDFYPKQGVYSVEADFMLKNKSEHPLSEIFITERIPLTHVGIEGGKLIERNSDMGIYLFQFENAIKPNDSVQLNFKLKQELKGYDEDYAIVENGSYLMHRSFEPILGYTTSYEIKNNLEREKRGLARRVEEVATEGHVILEEVKNEKQIFETIVSTDNNQIALSSGSLLKHWSENNRNYYHYKTDGKVLPSFAYFSGDYATRTISHNGISIEQYYDQNHGFNIENIEQSVVHTLDYCEENFGKFPFDHVRIAEVPSHWNFGGFAHPGMICMVEDNLYLSDVSDENTFDLVAKRTIHEIAHQWWGHTLSPKPIAGGSLFVEGLAKYTEAVIMERLYGKRAIYTLSENARSRYFTYRAFDGNLEPPVYLIEGQDYISYGKAMTVLMALRDLIGEDKINHVLKSITDKHRNSKNLEVTTIDLLNELYAISSTEKHELINDWFKKVIRYDLKIEDAHISKKNNEGLFEVSIDLDTKRFLTNHDGSESEIGINEPIKIGLFGKHPKEYGVNEFPIHLSDYIFNKEQTQLIIKVKEKPSFVAIDAYGTRSDENFTDNIFRIK